MKNVIAKSQADIVALETYLDQHPISKTGSTTRTADQFANIINGYLGQANALPDVLAQGGLAAQHAFYLQETAEQSRYMMSEPEEALAADDLCDDHAALSEGHLWIYL